MELQSAGHPAVIEYEPLSGVVIHITPLSMFTIQAMRDKAAAKLPYPDPEPYRLPLENAVDPSIKAPAEDNPEYRELAAAVDRQRNEWMVWSIIELACSFPAYPTRDDLVAHFRPRLEALRKVADLGADDWRNALDHCVFTGRQDKQLVVSLASQEQGLPLTAPEVVDGMRFFRLALPGNGTGKLARPSPRAEKQSEN